MIAHVVDRVRTARGLDSVWVATDDREIAAAAERAGARVAMTSPDCASGTDRVAEAALKIDADLVLNIQGDEPLLPPDAVESLAEATREAHGKGWPMATLARPLEAEEVELPQVVKVVRAEDGSAIYFSRAAIPYQREAGHVAPLAHVGLYGYTRAALARFAALPPAALERAEGLEQLRALAHGWKIAVQTGPWKTQAVDTEEDLFRVRDRLGREARAADGV